MEIHMNVTKPQEGPAPSNRELAAAIEFLTAHVIAGHKLARVVLGHLIALTPVDKRRDVINAMYDVLGRDSMNLTPALGGLSFQEIGRMADEIYAGHIDFIAGVVGKNDRS
jgi:hypothetical protein